jgi:hypothetical protein
MSVTVEAIYENGVLKPDQALPLKEQKKVTVTVQRQASPLPAAYGIMGWTGSAAEADFFALDPALDPQEDG